MANGVKDAFQRAFEQYGQQPSRLFREPPKPAPVISWYDESTHISDALLYGTSAMRTGTTVEDPLAKFKDHELIMALLKRGYAAMKLPADGGPPEVLRGQANSK